MDRGAWRATVHGVTESHMTEQLSTQSHTVQAKASKYYQLSENQTFIKQS